MLKWVFFFCLSDVKTRHLKNRLLEKCLVSYWFINLELFHPEWRNFEQNDMRFLNTGEDFFILRFWDNAFFSISPMPGSMSKFKCCTLSCLYESKLILPKVTTLIIVALDISVADLLAALCLISLLERVNSVKKLSDFFSFL